MKYKQQKQQAVKLKSTNFKYLRYARILCIVFILLFMAYIVMLMNQNSLGYRDVIIQYPSLTVGLFVCCINLFIWFKTRNMIIELDEKKSIDRIRIQLCLYAFSEFLVFNYPAAILFIITLYKNFEWKQHPLSSSFTYMKKHGGLRYIIMDCIILIILILMSLWFITAFSR